ncbi:MAG: glycine cleavage system aminomethyltransferase GcvT [Rhodospirillales bacterium]|nr:glycine cleavage system aminomethyltransferase GcvT [Rhodospirillales bacterium]
MADTNSEQLKQSPLLSVHKKMQGKLVPFAGYELPVQYPTGILTEHKHTREKVSLFDVSHMGQAVLRGENAAAALESLVPSDLQALPAGKMAYTVLTNDQGGIIDDLMVTNQGDHMHLVVNASRCGVDFAHIMERLEGRASLEVHTERALIALQGPQAAHVLARFAPAARHILFLHSVALTIADVPCLVTRSGYTGEDGFEISVPSEDATKIAALLISENEVEPAGLGARDSLRLEAGLCLYGHDINEATTPVEAGLSWVISKRRREEGGFPGEAVILQQLKDGSKRKRVGIKPEEKVPAREGAKVTDENGTEIGEITSGGFGPSVEGPIAMGYVETAHAQVGTAVNLMVRNKSLAAQVVKLPFVEHNYYRG